MRFSVAALAGKTVLWYTEVEAENIAAALRRIAAMQDFCVIPVTAYRVEEM